MKLFEDTKTMNAHFYLTSDGDATTRDDLLREMRASYPSYMVYLGGGFVPLKLAVQGFVHESEAWEAVQEWARKDDRLDEIGEDVKCPKCVRTEKNRDGKWIDDAVQMHWTINKDENDIHIWVCPSCLFECPQPESYGEVELVIQQIPDRILDTAWVLTRPFQSGSVDIFPADVDDIEEELPVARVLIEALEDILSEDQMKDLRSVYEVVTDDPRIKELIQ